MLPGFFYFSCAEGLTDIEHANNALSPIFNKEKEQKRLKQAQLIGEIGAQVMDVVRTEGELKAQKAAEAKGDAKVKRPQDGDSAKEWEAYKKALTESPTYKAEMQKYGTGSDFQRAAQAATAAIQALAGGDIQKAIASGASPYLAQLVKDVTLPKDESKITASDIAANAMAHAVVGAVVAQLSGQDVAAGAIGASSGELIARAIMADQYPGKTANDLTEEEKQSVSALSTLASGLISGLAGNSTASAASGAQSGRNAVENNSLAISCAHEPMACAKNPWLEGGAGPGGLAGGVSAAGAGAVIGEALNGDKDKSEQDSDQPNVGKNLSEGEKAELGGTGSGTPDGWGPEDEENARRNDDVSSNIPSRDKLNQAASASNRNGMTDAGRALQKHGGREGSVYSYSSQKASVLNQEAQTVVNEILNNTNTKIESRVVFENKQKITVVEATAPDGRALRFNADGTRLIGFREPPSK
ncbi:VENN motif pre-toxin domain-containing protein [Pectobacterium brasiliense]|uniref:VENN motif pre-toxin domain-containing protein n=1 Tax=Pectobacterium brasiliense TaxID=180957 RepID=UPI002404C15B|nr:VENN motif pre-toxin domain-containing protein [Pectobacterium brasiliense]MDG0806307.1 VENN motif pre-toxin domain-containing protein [Pectobacterium brasiliense]